VVILSFLIEVECSSDKSFLRSESQFKNKNPSSRKLRNALKNAFKNIVNRKGGNKQISSLIKKKID